MSCRTKSVNILIAVGILALIGTCFRKNKSKEQLAAIKETEAYEDSMKNLAFAAREKARIAAEEAYTIRQRATEDSLQKVKQAERHKAKYGWQYSASEAPMTSDSTYFANITSLNRLAPPAVWEEGTTSSTTKTTTTYKKRWYSGKRYPVTKNTITTSKSPDRQVTHYADVFLQLRKKSNTATDIMLYTTGGGFANVYEGVRIRFDKNKAEQYQTVGASDGSNKTLFIQSARSFIKKLKSCKKLLIEANVEGNGVQLFQFETENLQWKY